MVFNPDWDPRNPLPGVTPRIIIPQGPNDQAIILAKEHMARRLGVAVEPLCKKGGPWQVTIEGTKYIVPSINRYELEPGGSGDASKHQNTATLVDWSRSWHACKDSEFGVVVEDVTETPKRQIDTVQMPCVLYELVPVMREGRTLPDGRKGEPRIVPQPDGGGFVVWEAGFSSPTVGEGEGGAGGPYNPNMHELPLKCAHFEVTHPNLRGTKWHAMQAMLADPPGWENF